MWLYVKVSDFFWIFIFEIIDLFVAYKDESVSFILGYNSIVSWSISIDGQATLVYSTVDRQTIVNLVCSQELDQLLINNEYEKNHYNLTLFSKCACWNQC